MDLHEAYTNVLKEHATRHPDYADVWNSLGLMLAEKQNYAGALNAFAECRIVSQGDDGYGCTIQTDKAEGLSMQDACSGPNTNIGFHTVIPFSSACDGTFNFRFHADYGLGGYGGIDGVSHQGGDIWGHVSVSYTHLRAHETDS